MIIKIIFFQASLLHYQQKRQFILSNYSDGISFGFETTIPFMFNQNGK